MSSLILFNQLSHKPPRQAHGPAVLLLYAQVFRSLCQLEYHPVSLDFFYDARPTGWQGYLLPHSDRQCIEYDAGFIHVHTIPENKKPARGGYGYNK
jgi:hypothetical protein